MVIHSAGDGRPGRGLGVADMMRDVMLAEGLSHEEAIHRFWALGSRGLLVDDEQNAASSQSTYSAGALRRARSRPTPAASAPGRRTGGHHELQPYCVRGRHKERGAATLPVAGEQQVSLARLRHEF